jgi:hypothetical protein
MLFLVVSGGLLLAFGAVYMAGGLHLPFLEGYFG